MQLRKRFSDSDLDRIKAAVKKAEDKISGEIVPVIVERSGHYPIANYKSSIAVAALTFFALIMLDRYILDPSYTLYYDPMFIFFVVFVMGTLGYFLPDLSSKLRRFFVGQRLLDEATSQLAENAFLE